MPKQVIGKVVAPPTGWAFTPEGELTPAEGVKFNTESFDALYAWAKTKKYGLIPNLNQCWYQDGWDIYCRYTVMTDSWAETEKWLGDGTWAPRGTLRVSLGEMESYSPARRTSYYNNCANCGRAGLKSSVIILAGVEQRFCVACTKKCTGCDAQIATVTRIIGGDPDKCFNCVPRKQCRYCRGYAPADELSLTNKEKLICGECSKTYTCATCNNVCPGDIVQHEGKSVCNTCYGEAVDKERASHEAFGDDELPDGGTLVLESLSNRPVRVVSIETEIDGDAVSIANTLYNAGLVREALVESYSTQCPDSQAWPAFLKHDGSVTGGELITYLLQLNKPEHAESLKEVLSKLRSLEKINKVAYNANCGGHIHIDAHNFSSDNVWRLLTGYNYVEDIIFRLAGAGHEYGHRTLVPGHDRANNGRGYSHPTAKGPWGVKSGAALAAAQQDRMTGLNFKPYFNAVNYCACGAGVENLRSCKCVLPKCTIEWRVWNSQGNPRILHAWIAFMQSLHAWSDIPREMTNEEEASYPPLGWTRLAWKDTSAGHQNIVLERIQWIFENLVFSPAEKESLIFAFQHTDIEFSAEFWVGIRALGTPRNRTVKTPRNCTIRTHPIEKHVPERKVFGDARRDPGYMAERNLRRTRPRFANIAPGR